MALVTSPWDTARLHLRLTGQLLLRAWAPGQPGRPGPGWGRGPCPPALKLTSSPPACSISNKELSELIDQLQKNADQVERNIVDTEAKMQSVSAPHLPPGCPPSLSLQPPSGPGSCLTQRFPPRVILPPGDMWPYLQTFLAVTTGGVQWLGI